MYRAWLWFHYKREWRWVVCTCDAPEFECGYWLNRLTGKVTGKALFNEEFGPTPSAVADYMKRLIRRTV